jgi:transcriptional regulator with XRE-family HTH domain
VKPTAFDDRVIYREIGQKIRNVRQGKLSQEELADKVGLSRVSLCNIEKGKQRVPLHTLLVASACLNVDVRELLPDNNFIAQALSGTNFESSLAASEQEAVFNSSEKMQYAVKDILTLVNSV